MSPAVAEHVSEVASRSENLRNRICRALTETGYRSLARVDVHIDEGRVRLTGSVLSFYQKQLATAAVFSVEPNVTLQNRLQVANQHFSRSSLAQLPSSDRG